MNRIWNALFYSLDGMKKAWADEQAFRQEVWLSLIGVPLAFLLAPDRLSLVLMVAVLLMVLVVELLNTAIEAAIDRHGAELHPEAKKAKDCGSAAVLLSLILAGFTWGIILLS